MATCIGKKSWTINVASFVDKTKGDSCTSKLAQFYAQVSWKFDANELKRRDFINKVMVFQSVVTILLLLFYFHWTHSSLKEKFKEWDQRTTTIEDFTICVKINQKLYDKFILNEYKQTPNDNPIFAFKAYLRNEISKLINQGNASDQQNDSQIVDIEFTFSNILLLELMQKRANAIEEGNNEKRIEIEKEVVKEYSSNSYLFNFIYRKSLYTKSRICNFWNWRCVPECIKAWSEYLMLLFICKTKDKW